MARPQKCRRICAEPRFDRFAPAGCAGDETIVLTVDEYETIRLIDLERRTQAQCAVLMGISRTAVTGMYDRARFKLADAIVNGKKLVITGGRYRLCDGSMQHCCGMACGMHTHPQRHTIPNKGENDMTIAVTYQDEQVFQHFGHTAQFKLYDIADNAIAAARIVDTMGSGHGALAAFLVQNGVDVLICGGIGGGAKTALSEAGIALYGGVTGNADEAVAAFLNGTLTYDPAVACSHHHAHGEHHCGEEKHGCRGNHA